MRDLGAPDWAGRTVVCIASGPSLTVEDCEAVRYSGCPVVVTNTSFRRAPWADVLFGYDSRWWQAHIAEVRERFTGRLMSASQIAGNFGVEPLTGSSWFRGRGNSGACAIAIAIAGQAARVLLLGYDCMPGPAGERHWHGDHPKGFSQASTMAKWPGHFQEVAQMAQRAGVAVINCSRRTALQCFERGELEQCLK